MLMLLLLLLLPANLQNGVIANARNPAHDAWLYNPKAASGARFTTLAATNINRYYHSTALLLPDASILIMGSEYGEWAWQQQQCWLQPVVGCAAAAALQTM
jgi:hypothetical protein